MVKKAIDGQGTDQQLPKLGIAPYRNLMHETAAAATDRHASYMGLLLLWLSDNILDLMDQELSEFGITESKLDLLILLLLHEDREVVTPSEIADRLGIRRASATALLDWLEKRKWIVREQADQDRRRVSVRLTAEGRGLVDRVLPTFWSTCASLLGGLNEEEQQVFEKVLVKLNDSMEKRLGVGR